MFLGKWKIVKKSEKQRQFFLKVSQKTMENKETLWILKNNNWFQDPLKVEHNLSKNKL